MADVRWKQRLQNFDRAFVLLRSGLESKELDAFTDLEREGLIQRFEYTYELGWKTLKDYLEDSGVVVSPVTPGKSRVPASALRNAAGSVVPARATASATSLTAS